MSSHPIAPSSPGRSLPPTGGARSPFRAAAGSGDGAPSLRARVARFFSREGPGGLTVAAWAAVAAAAVAVALAAWNEQRLQEKAREAERELTSSSDDWRHAKREAKEAARDARSAATKWSKGQ